MEDYAWEVLESGRVIPGYGHAVLRTTDPRFIAFHEFGWSHMAGDPVFRTVDVGYRVIPEVLRRQGKAANPWPNVDAGSGALLHHFGITEQRFYTVLFSVSRALGMAAQLVMSRALGEPIVRPKSVTSAWVRQEVARLERELEAIAMV
jgi:citrate synthase